MAVAQRWWWCVKGLGLGQDPDRSRAGRRVWCEDICVYILTSVSPLTVLTHHHPTPGMVMVGAGVWLVGGCLSDDGASRVVGDDRITDSQL